MTEQIIKNRYGAARDQSPSKASEMAIDFWNAVAPSLAQILTADNALEHHRHPELDIATIGVPNGDTIDLEFRGDSEVWHSSPEAQDWFDNGGFRRGVD